MNAIDIAHRATVAAPRQAEHQRLQGLLDALCGRRAGGRLSGSAGARYAAALVAQHWAALGLQPMHASGYLRPVQVPEARLMGPVRLEIGGVLLRHRQDFAEATAFSRGGDAVGPLRWLDLERGLPPDRLSGAILLLPQLDPSLDIDATARAAAELGARALLIGVDASHGFDKSVQGGQGALPVLRVRQSLIAPWAEAGEPVVRVALPLLAGVAACHNVVGVLPGSRHDRALLITAHHDHVGDDPSGARFPGAFDNASGVALMVQLAHRLARMGPETRPFDIVFASLTGEESGLHGAQALLKETSRRWIGAINLDALGLRHDRLALRTGHAGTGDPFAERCAHWLRQQGLEVDRVDGRDDSAALRAAGLPTLGLGQQPRQGLWPMHTPEDLPAALDLAWLHDLTDLLDQLLQQVATWSAAPSTEGVLV